VGLGLGELTAALSSHRARQAEERLAAGRRWQDGDFAFTSPAGRSLDSANVTHGFQAAWPQRGSSVSAYLDLRHACATLRHEQAGELALVSRILGHATITTTANVCGHLTDAILGKAAEWIDTILGLRASAASRGTN